MLMDRLAVQISRQAIRTLCLTPSNRFTAAALQRRCNIQRRHKATSNGHDSQAIPHTGYYADILSSRASPDSDRKDVLDEPLEKIQPATRTAPEPPSAESLPKTEKEERIEKAQIIFGTRLAGPVERHEQVKAASHDVAGILVPPKPEEPDNCCMSGCVNCVWDVYRDDLEEWASKSAEARRRIQIQRGSGEATGIEASEPGMPSHVASSMDDDGGGSDTNWNSGLELSGKPGDLFEGIPVGIREFMRTEKNLKQKHSEEKAAGT